MSTASGPKGGGTGKCIFAVLVPLAIAMATILSSTIMAGVSEDVASESHRLEREAIWDIPVMDTLRMWKRSMGTVGSGKLRLEDSYENGEIQVQGLLQRARLLPERSPNELRARSLSFSFSLSLSVLARPQFYNTTERYYTKVLENTVSAQRVLRWCWHLK